MGTFQCRGWRSAKFRVLAYVLYHVSLFPHLLLDQFILFSCALFLPYNQVPNIKSSQIATQNPKLLLHEVLLAGWGMPIGELFDLERLAEHCKRVGRWSFFLSSEVCCVTGGVASPPNAVAIF